MAPHFLHDDAEMMVRAELAGQKATLRHQMLLRRAGFGPAAAGESAALHLLAALPPRPGDVVAGYWPIGNELDPRSLLLALAKRGHPIVLPVTPPRGVPLSFRVWVPDEGLVPGRFGTVQPSSNMPEAVPTFVIVPLLAFDRRGGRLGYGAGYYDRTLSALPAATAVGLAFSCQEVPVVPVGPNDVPLRAVVTEHGVVFPEFGAEHPDRKDLP